MEVEISKQKIYKSVLGNYFTNTLNKRICLSIKNKGITVNNNYVIKTAFSTEVLKNLYTYLIIKEYEENINFKFDIVTITRLMNLEFSNNEDDKIILSRIKSSQFLIIEEFADSTAQGFYKGFFNPFITNRIMSGKTTFFILTTKKLNDLLNDDVVSYFKEVSLYNEGIKSIKQENKIF